MGEEKRGTGVGLASVLLIVMVLAFTTFGVLSLVSARTDVKLSRKAATTMAAYYEAEGALQEQLADLDEELLMGALEVPEDGQFSLTADVQETQQLQLLVELNQEPVKGVGRFRVLFQKLVNTTEWNPNVEIDIWDGGM